MDMTQVFIVALAAAIIVVQVLMDIIINNKV